MRVGQLLCSSWTHVSPARPESVVAITPPPPAAPRAAASGSGRCGSPGARDRLRACRWRRCVPPPSPPSGPMSMMWSAVLMTSRLCSMTTTVLPCSTSSCSTSSSLRVSSKCRPGRRLVEDVERAPGGAPRQLLRQLHPLRLAAGERRRLLADLDVAEADPHQRRHLLADRRHRGEERLGVLHRHVEHVGDALALEQDLQRLAVVALALAGLAGDVDVGQEVHLDLDDAVALAGLAAPALDVEAEPPRLVAARLALRQPGEPVADRAEGAGVGGGVRARRAPDRRLVDVDDLVEVLEPLDRLAAAPGSAARRSAASRRS